VESPLGHYPSEITILTPTEDIDRWAVCLGRDALEKISRAHKG